MHGITPIHHIPAYRLPQACSRTAAGSLLVVGVALLVSGVYCCVIGTSLAVYPPLLGVGCLCILVGGIFLPDRRLPSIYKRVESNPKTPLRETLPKTYLYQSNQGLWEGNITAEAEQIRTQLALRAGEHISFNPQSLVNRIDGGVCMAFALNFIALYLKYREEANCYSSAEEKIHFLYQKIESLKLHFINTIEELRNQQAAFNTIEVVYPLQPNRNYGQEKVQALANLYSLDATSATSEFAISPNESSGTHRDLITRLPEGVFLGRFIRPASNSKLEEWGHSIVYIREGDIHLLFDPNLGVEILSCDRYTYSLENNIFQNAAMFQLERGCFYQMALSSLVEGQALVA